MKRSGKMEPASEALREAQDVLRRNDAFQFWLFRQRWPSFVGEVFAEESYIARRDGALLCIYATNSVWMQELLMRKAEILRRIREDPYGAQFRDLRVQIGPRPRALRPESPVDRLAPLYDRRKSRTPLTEGEEAWISRWADAHVARDELRGPIEELMRGALRRRKDELAAGWHPCARCGDLCPAKDRLCARCEAEEERQTRSRIVLLLKEKPELLYDDVRRAVPCTYRQFAEARDILIHRYRQNHYNRCGMEEERRRLLSLLTHRPFASITESEAKKILSALPVKKIYAPKGRKDGISYESGK